MNKGNFFRKCMLFSVFVIFGGFLMSDENAAEYPPHARYHRKKVEKVRKNLFTFHVSQKNCIFAFLKKLNGR